MKAIVTGMNGTVAPVLAKRLQRENVDIIAWDRSRVGVDDPSMVRSFIRQHQPDWVCHLAMGSPAWAATMADECRASGTRFLFTGTCSVFDGSKPGPFSVDREPNATDDYGRYKAECERQIWAVNPDAMIARLGWQIGDAPGSNNMLDYLYRMAKEKGSVEVSTGMMHSCAFLEDSADALCRLLLHHAPGLYQLEGNPGLTHHEIVQRLHQLHRFPFPIIAKEEPRHDIRMINDAITMGMLTDRLPKQ
jgi:dTDP-4-dehydrorhamnose reductase